MQGGSHLKVTGRTGPVLESAPVVGRREHFWSSGLWCRDDLVSRFEKCVVHVPNGEKAMPEPTRITAQHAYGGIQDSRHGF
jgi:hypothetical protein